MREHIRDKIGREKNRSENKRKIKIKRKILELSGSQMRRKRKFTEDKIIKRKYDTKKNETGNQVERKGGK